MQLNSPYDAGFHLVKAKSVHSYEFAPELRKCGDIALAKNTKVHARKIQI